MTKSEQTHSHGPHEKRWSDRFTPHWNEVGTPDYIRADILDRFVVRSRFFAQIIAEIGGEEDEHAYYRGADGASISLQPYRRRGLWECWPNGTFAAPRLIVCDEELPALAAWLVARNRAKKIPPYPFETLKPEIAFPELGDHVQGLPIHSRKAWARLDADVREDARTEPTRETEPDVLARFVRFVHDEGAAFVRGDCRASPDAPLQLVAFSPEFAELDDHAFEFAIGRAWSEQDGYDILQAPASLVACTAAFGFPRDIDLAKELLRQALALCPLPGAPEA